MNTKKVFKRLTAVAVGATMMGATLMGALAVDLSDYPDMFVSEGTFDGYFVVGESAATVDNLAMTDISNQMWYTSTGESETVTVEGDAWVAETSGNFLELDEAINSVESYLDDSHLGALADGEISNAKGTSEYEQFLYFDEADATVNFQEDDDDNLDFFYKVDSGDVIARYVLDFTTSLESDIDVDDSSRLDDIEDEMITILGKTFTIVTAINGTSGPELTLMGGAVSDTISEGETATYEVLDTTYEVTLESVTSTQVQFTINGETTNKLEDGETDVLEDDTNIGVTDITYQDYAGGIHTASFFLGADKVLLDDGASLRVNEETISEAAVEISESESSGDITIDEIFVNMTADDDYYVGIGAKLSEYAELDEPEVLFTQNWDIELASVDTGTEEIVKMAFSEGDEQADLKLTPYGGDEVSLSLVWANASALTGGEDSDELLKFPGYEAITDEDIFVLSTANPTDDTTDAKSYFLQYKGADDTDEDNPKARIKNLATGETYERSVAAAGTFDLKLGGETFNFVNTSSAGSDDFSINYTTGGNEGASVYATDGYQQAFRTEENNEVTITNVNASDLDGDWLAWVIVDDTDKYDDAGDAEITVMNVTLSYDATEDEVNADAGTVSATLITDPDDDDIQYGRSVYGELLTVTASSDSGGPSTYEVSIPDTQAEVKLYVTSGATNSVVSGDGVLAKVEVVDATKLDSEIADATAQNLIVVGGPCINTVAADLLGAEAGFPACAEGFNPGTARVKLFDNDGMYAMLVAGYSGEDTRLAGKVIAHRYDELTGEEVEIEGTTYSDATIGAPLIFSFFFSFLIK